jgi:hypothetical protein
VVKINLLHLFAIITNPSEIESAKLLTPLAWIIHEGLPKEESKKPETY